jgi:predicted dehydrogenase
MIRYGVLGVGHLGRFHAIQSQQINSCQLTALFDLNTDRLNEVAAELSVKAANSLDDFFNSVDALSLVTITSSHYKLAKEAISRGKHVLIEKPITETVEEANELIELAKKHQVKVQVGHIERFNSATRALRDIDLKPMFIESHRLASFNIRGTDVAVILDLMIHDIDLISTLVKSEVKHISANGMAVISDTEDIANCRIEFENACVANITASRISASRMRKMRLFQKNAYLSLDFDLGTSDVYYIGSSSEQFEGDLPIELGALTGGKSNASIRYQKYEKEDINPLREEILSFVNAIETNTEPVVSAEDGRKALKIAIEIIAQIAK